MNTLKNFHYIKTVKEETGWLYKFQMPWDLLLLKTTSQPFTCKSKDTNEDHKIRFKID